MNKTNILYKAMSWCRIRFFIINILLTILFVMYTVSKVPYLKTAWFGESPLDIDRFISSTSVITVDELVELTRKDRQNPDGSYLKKTSYWQDDSYLFSIKVDSVKQTDIVFRGMVNNLSSQAEYADMYKLYIAEAGGRKFALLAFADQVVTEQMTACLVHMQKPVLAGLSRICDEEGPMDFSEYVIDVRGLEMEAESSDHFFFWVYLAGLIFLYTKLLMHFFKPMTTPTFRQLSRYGEALTVAEEIDRQSKLPSARRNGKDIIIDEFILTKGFFKMHIAKNHMAKN